MIVALLSQVAEMERSKIRERTAAGRAAAKASFEATGKTHKGKASLGRPEAANKAQVKAWRELNSASISQTARQFKISEATVKTIAAYKAIPFSASAFLIALYFDSPSSTSGISIKFIFVILNSQPSVSGYFDLYVLPR